MFYFQPPCQHPLAAAPLKGAIVPAWHSNRGGLKRKKTFSAQGMFLSRLCVHGFDAAFLEPTQTRQNSIIPVTEGSHFPVSLAHHRSLSERQSTQLGGQGGGKGGSDDTFFRTAVWPAKARLNEHRLQIPELEGNLVPLTTQ